LIVINTAELQAPKEKEEMAVRRIATITIPLNPRSLLDREAK